MAGLFVCDYESVGKMKSASVENFPHIFPKSLLHGASTNTQKF